MATTFTFARGACFGNLTDDLDPNGYYTEEQYEQLEEIFTDLVHILVSEYDDTLRWFPYTSEVYGIVGETESDACDFEEWWERGADGMFESLWHDAMWIVDTLSGEHGDDDTVAASIKSVFNSLPTGPSDIWCDGSEILCKKERTAELYADLLDDIAGERIAHTGFYDPAEDERSNEVDNHTGYYYVDLD